jgi:hypothetical protein
MSGEQRDPERLLAEALRAQAVQAPVEASGPPMVRSVEHSLPLLAGAEPGYGLLSGHEAEMGTIRGPATGYQEGRTVGRGPVRRSGSPRVTTVLLFALVLGLLAGGTLGVLTLV